MAGGSARQASKYRRGDRRPWHERPTIRELKQRTKRDRLGAEELDAQENAASRLPEDEAVHLGGFVLTEAFPPSTLSALNKAIARWPESVPGRRAEILDRLARSRRGDDAGWQALGMVRPPGTLAIMGHEDPNLPAGVDAAWVQVSYLTPALAMVVAVVVLSESSGDLSTILRSDYKSETTNPHVNVEGRLGWLASRIPWARPRRYIVGEELRWPDAQKASVAEALMRDREEACWQWLAAAFPGRFSQAPHKRRPVIRLLFTKAERPYEQRPGWFRPVHLDLAYPMWRSDPAGWWLTEDMGPVSDQRPVVKIAARRSDVATKVGGGDHEANWNLVQDYGQTLAPLAARLAIIALMSLYRERIAGLRDKAGRRRRLPRPIHEARLLDDYLARDGLDAATVAADVTELTADPRHFGWHVPDFREYVDMLGPTVAASYEPGDFVTAARERSQAQAERLVTNASITTENARASAELRQAIANTQLQVFTIVLAVIAAAIAVISLLTNAH